METPPRNFESPGRTPPRFNSTNDSGGSSNSSGSKTLRRELEERQQLEKANFELKMKVLQLEDAFQVSRNGDKVSASDADSAKTEIMNLRLELDEKAIELEQRNILLLKAKAAIQALKSDKNKHQEEFSSLMNRKIELEGEFKRVKTEQDQMEQRYELQMEEFKRNSTEHQAIAARAESQAKEIERLQANNKEIKEELDKAKSRVEQYELFQQTLREELDSVRMKSYSVQSEQDKAMSELKHQLGHSTEQYEGQISALKESLLGSITKEELERLKEEHNTALKNARKTHSEEIAQYKLEATEQLTAQKSQDLAVPKYTVLS